MPRLKIWSSFMGDVVIVMVFMSIAGDGFTGTP